MALDDTPERGNDEGHDDCFGRLSFEAQREVSEAITDKSLFDASVVMKKHKMCDSCMLYYMTASLFIFFRRSGVPFEHVSATSYHAIIRAYDPDFDPGPKL